MQAPMVPQKRLAILMSSLIHYLEAFKLSNNVMIRLQLYVQN